MAIKKSGVIGKPDLSPNTESIEHLGQKAVWPIPLPFLSVHWLISDGGNVCPQWKQPQILLAITSERWSIDLLWAALTLSNEFIIDFYAILAENITPY